MLLVLTESPIYGANGTRLNQLSNLDTQGEESCPDSLHEEQILGLGRCDQLLHLCGRHGDGLFTEHILACFEREHDVLEVMTMRRGYVDDLDVGIRDELCVRAIGFGRGGTANLLDEAGSPVA